MKVKISFLCLISMFLSVTPTAFADFKLRQQTTIETGGGESFTMERDLGKRNARANRKKVRRWKNVSNDTAKRRGSSGWSAADAAHQ